MENRPKGASKENSRREFLRGFFNMTGDVVLKATEAKLTPPEVRFARPPGALPEAEFLEACTHCGECVPACPHRTIFILGGHTGGAKDTPALDLAQRACHLCEDFPCIAACEPRALELVEPVSPDFPIKFHVRIQINQRTCLPFHGPECGICVSLCPVPGAITLNSTCPEINAETCVGCAMCREVCVVTPSAITVHPLAAG